MKTESTNLGGLTLRTLKPISLATALALTLLAGAAHAQTYTVLHHFAGSPSDGMKPLAGLVLDGDTLYGTTLNGGSNIWGTVFKLKTDGTGYTVLRHFADLPSGGATPYAGLLLSGGTLYGTTYDGGSNHLGTVFKLNTNGTGFTVLKHFPYSLSDGQRPCAGLVLSGGTLYGTTLYGGTNGAGTVFKLNTNGTGYTVLKYLDGQTEGGWPRGALALSGSILYGTTELFPYNNGSGVVAGTLFKLNTNGTGFSVLKYFTNHFDGTGPWAGLLLGGDTLYGTTVQGGTNNTGVVFKLNTNGTGFTVLKHFNTKLGPGNPPYFNSGGVWPYAGLLLSGNTLYGTAREGGPASGGTVFQVNTDGTGFTVLKNFSYASSVINYPNSDGAHSRARLVMSGSTLYGTTYEGGQFARGTVFKIDLATPATVTLGPVSFSNGVPQIPVTGAIGQGLQIQVSTNLLPPWEVLTNFWLDWHDTGQFSDPAATNFPARFYRALVYME